MLNLALIGKDVSASLSPQMHSFLLGNMGEKCRYEKISLSPERFGEQIEEILSRYEGLNVTIPFKTEIIPRLSGLRGDAISFGAVNTVVCGERIGYNTDGYGFMLMLENAGIDVRGKRVLVLGAGGAGRSCIKKLLDAGAHVSVFERDEARRKAVHRELGGFQPLCAVEPRKYGLIVNCTGVGMHATVGQSPVGKEVLALCDLAVDLIYEPKKSEFLRLAEELGKRAINGEAMLFYQAYLADCIFLSRKSDPSEAKRLFTNYQEGKA